ncbi:MAG TPA: Fur family transcriptional regulator [Patescibacteria group bacterium]|nr:Fur family transcriptional regulator [Patescibacteria group bacterium]
MKQKINHSCKGELQQMDLRATPARIAIMQLLEATQEPVDVGSIVVSLQKKSIAADPATVFRIMNVFTQKGLIVPIEFQEGKMRYELASKDDHHHLVCENCGKVEDIEDTLVPALEKHIHSYHHFLVKRHVMEFFGLCKKCQKKEKNN